VGRWGPPIVLVGVILLIWEGYVRLAGLDPITLPAPSRVLGSLWDFRETAAGHLVPTLVEAAVGCALSVTLAIGAAIALDRWELARRAVEPLLVTSQTIPIVAIAPLFVIWFGFGLLPKVLIVVLVTFFPVVIALLDGFGRVDPDAMTLMRSIGATQGQTFRWLRWPSALPALFTGLRISVVYAVIGAIFGEYVGATQGLGIWMKLSQNTFRTDLVFGAILLTAVVSVALYVGVGLVERVVVPWSPAMRARATLAPRSYSDPMPKVSLFDVILVIAYDLAVVAVVGLMVYATWVYVGRRIFGRGSEPRESRAMAILKDRLASGEIDETEYQRLRSVIISH
jgi:ABC-type nitrate/sulfonate/bicarbonate transport system permease component